MTSSVTQATQKVLDSVQNEIRIVLAGGRENDYFIVLLQLQQKLVEVRPQNEMLVLLVVGLLLLNQDFLRIVDHGLVHVQHQRELVARNLRTQKRCFGLADLFLELVPQALFAVLLDQSHQVFSDFFVGLLMLLFHFRFFSTWPYFLFILLRTGRLGQHHLGTRRLFEVVRVDRLVGESIRGPAAKTHHGVLVPCEEHPDELLRIQRELHKGLAVEDDSDGCQELIVLAIGKGLIEIQRRYEQETRFIELEQARVLLAERLQQSADDARDQVVDLLQMVAHLVLPQLLLRQAEIGLLFGQQLLQFRQVLGLLPVKGVGARQEQLDFVDEHRVEVLHDFVDLQRKRGQLGSVEDLEVDVRRVQRVLLSAAVLHQEQHAHRHAPNFQYKVLAQRLLNRLFLGEEHAQIVRDQSLRAAEVLEQGFFDQKAFLCR